MAIVEMKVPAIGESVTEVTLSQWLKANGDFVNIDEAICEFESDKATLEFPAEVSGKLIHVAAEDDDLVIGALVAKIDTSVKGDTTKTKPITESKASESTADVLPSTIQTASKNINHPSPSAAKILREKDIDPAQISGSGKDGRITKQDAVNASKPIEQNPNLEATPTPVIKTIFSRATRREKMSRMRRTIASRLVEAKNNTAMLTTFNEVDLTNIIQLRKKHQEQFVAKYDVKLGFMSLFAKACAQVLLEIPQVNAFIDGNELIYHDYVDISIAISTDTGLVVPPVHNCESLHFSEIELKIKALAKKARNGTLTLAEMKGGTFSITNGGIFGSMMSTPILNRPQSAILGMHTIKQRPIVVNGEVQIRPMMYLALSYDHRVIDGSSSVTFLVKVIEKLENPEQMLLDL